MADVAPINSSSVPNFALMQQEPGAVAAGANLQNQQAALTSQQAQQQQMQTQLLKQAMPLYQQTISNTIADMSGTSAGNAMSLSGQSPQALTDSSGASAAPGSPPMTPAGQNPQTAQDNSGTPAYADSGAIAEQVRQQNYVQPYTPGEQRAIMNGAMMAALPGPAANPAYLKMAQMQQQFRVANQTRQNQYQSGQLYDTMTAVQDPTNPNPLAMLAALPGQQAVAAQIVKDNPGDPDAQNAAARNYAQMVAYNAHLYTGRPTTLQNGVEIDTANGAPVTGQEQVLTGLTPEERAKAKQWAQEPIPVTLNTGKQVPMSRYQAPTTQGGLGMTPDAYVAQQDAIARARLSNPNAPEPGLNTWNSPTAIGNTSGAQAASQGNTLPQHAPGQIPGPPAGTRPATGPQLQNIRAQQSQSAPVQQAADMVPSPTTALKGPVPPTGTPAYNARMSAALQDPTYNARWNVTAAPGTPIPGAEEGIKEYQTQRNTLMQEAGQNAQAADQAMQNFNAAKMIINSANSTLPLTGPVGALEQKVAATLGLPWQAAATRQEVAKYLVNGAVSNLKTTYGSRPGVFDVKINVEQAFPNVSTMSPPALSNLIDSQISQAQYIKDSAVRAQQYANRGKEPNAFSTWNSTYFPRSELLDTQYGAGAQAGAGGGGVGGTNAAGLKTTAPPVGTIEKGYKYMGGDVSKPTSWQRAQ